MATINTDILQGNFSLSLEAGDVAKSIIFRNASSVDVSALTIANASTISSASTLTLNPAVAVDISSKALNNVANILMVPGTASSNVNTIWSNSSGLYFGAGKTSGNTKLVRSLNEAYGNVASDANIAVSSYPVLFFDTAGTGNVVEVRGLNNSVAFSASNTAVSISRATTLAGNLSVTGVSSFVGDVTVNGNMNVSGNVTTINSEQVNLADSTLYLNSGYTAVSGKSGGLAINYLPTADTVTVTSAVFTPGVPATSNPTITTLPGAQAWAVDGVVIQVSGTTNNNGIYEILSSTATTLTIRGVGLSGNSANLLDIAANQFISETAASAVITRVNIAVLRASPTGSWQTAGGSNSAALAYKNIGNVSFTGTAPSVNTISVFSDTSGGNITATSVTVSGANLTTTGNISAGNLISTGLLSGTTLSTTPAANSIISVANVTAGASKYVLNYKGQSTNGTYANIGVFNIGVANSTTIVKFDVVGKRDNSTHSISAFIRGGFIADAAGVLSAQTLNTKDIFRSAGTSGNYNANLIVSGGNVCLQIRGDVGQTVNWQAVGEITYSNGFS